MPTIHHNSGQHIVQSELTPDPVRALQKIQADNLAPSKGLPFAPNLDNTFDATRNTGTNNQSREEATAGIVE